MVNGSEVTTVIRQVLEKAAAHKLEPNLNKIKLKLLRVLYSWIKWSTGVICATCIFLLFISIKRLMLPVHRAHK